jgi:hypothetical protein
MPSLAETAEGTTRRFAVFCTDGHEFDRGSADEMIEIAQSLGAVARLDDDRDLDERGERTSDGHRRPRWLR